MLFFFYIIIECVRMYKVFLNIILCSNKVDNSEKNAYTKMG